MGRHREFDEDRALDAAVRVFWQKGYEGTSFDDLTRATGVARPGLYAAFGNKEAFFRKAVDRYEATSMAFMREALEAPTAREVVQRILEGCAKVQTASSASRGCLGVNGALACSDDAEDVRQHLVDRRAASELGLKKRLERAKREGDLPSAANAAMLASYVMTMTQGMAVQAKAGASRATLEAIAAHALSTWPSAAAPKQHATSTSKSKDVVGKR